MGPFGDHCSTFWGIYRYNVRCCFLNVFFDRFWMVSECLFDDFNYFLHRIVASIRKLQKYEIREEYNAKHCSALLKNNDCSLIYLCFFSSVSASNFVSICLDI